MQLVAKQVYPYFGNGPYCYSNATSMLLSSIGEDIPPWKIEVYTGVGLGAFWLSHEKLLFFSSIANPPDKGITRALKLLGFDFKETSSEHAGSPPFEQLKSDLSSSPAVLGPLDMGYLTHNPLHNRMEGADHFVLAYAIDDEGISIHDPEGFPSVKLPLRRLELTWRAESIGYRRGYYRYWTSPARVISPSKDQLYRSTLQSFKEVYSEAEKLASSNKWSIDQEAILTLAKYVRGGEVSAAERGFMIHFAFKLGARRALDFATFFASQDPGLASLKREQSELFGTCQAQAVERKWMRLAQSIQQLADVESQFRKALLTI